MMDKEKAMIFVAAMLEFAWEEAVEGFAKGRFNPSFDEEYTQEELAEMARLLNGMSVDELMDHPSTRNTVTEVLDSVRSACEYTAEFLSTVKKS